MSLRGMHFNFGEPRDSGSSRHVSQAAFARLVGITPRQVNNWCRGRAAVPVWAAIIAIVLQHRSAEALTIDLEEARLALTAPQDPRPSHAAPAKSLPR